MPSLGQERAPSFELIGAATLVAALSLCACSQGPGASACPEDAGPAPGADPQVALAPVDRVLPESFDHEAIDTYLRMTVRELGFVGLSVAIMRRGEVVFAEGYGQRSLDPAAPVDAMTQFAMASNTKQFTCAGALLLAQEGKLDMREPVAAHYPALTRATDIALLDLLQHTSGYPDFYPLDFVVSDMAAPAQTEAVVLEYGTKALDFEPRARWSYSNTGYLIVGRIIERVSGVSFAEFARARIFEVLGMSRSVITAESKADNAARGYVSFALGEPEPAVREGEGWLHAAGGLWSTPSDLLRWDLALMDGELLAPESFELMTTPATLSDGRTTTYGCGLGIGRVEGEEIFSHGGAIDGFLSRNVMIPRTRSALAVATNGYHVDPTPVIDALLAGLIAAEQDQPGPPSVDGPPATEAAVGLLRQMQAGAVDRGALSEEFSAFMTDARLEQAAPRLAALGEPLAVELVRARERGGMESATVRMIFADPAAGPGEAQLEVLVRLFRAPDGTIHQFVLQR